ncbi:hypothetical protein BU26DRAFT_431992 [Trematosphaeria pertusa]|uniref:Uncharacterized protein n=1 Tax=Trematosphaeria pertusa TaxID=390896 RepID=A0A6A6I6H6_9PLEO|nr:uncharacterized protein BU26DRAFT_431992 [Trematosphaeria pertusa]KAF2246125.1 hypothetical protein BU26DRAFT_431992 [Trematosphaeria pertusa]
MPHLPFNTTPSPSSSPKTAAKTAPSPPSIVLHPASGSASKKELYKSSDDMAAAYRKRYAQYLAATFNMSLEAAMVEADTQLAPRRCSDVSEAETFRER